MDLYDRLSLFLKNNQKFGKPFMALDIHRELSKHKKDFPEFDWRYGQVAPYSERLEGAIYVLLAKGDLVFNPRNSCKFLLANDFVPLTT